MHTVQKSDRGVPRTGRVRSGGLSDLNGRNHGIASEEAFTRMLQLERKRTERSRKQFVLMLLHVETLLSDRRKNALEDILSALFASVRETDARGWYKDNAV